MLQVRHGDRLQQWLLRHMRFGPAIGALLGLTPGCGLEIALMPLYVRGGGTFGTGRRGVDDNGDSR